MIYNCDLVIDRHHSDSSKWQRYGDALPMWVADMDFRSAEPIIEALRRRVEHGVFGYPTESEEFRQLIIERMDSLYGWKVSLEEIVFIAGVVPGFNMAAQSFTVPGDGILIQTPVYYPMLAAVENASCRSDAMELTRDADGSYTIDLDRFERTITPRTKVFLLCSPHNPVGRVFRRNELERMAEICLRHKVIICSDEIHCDLLFDGHLHIPIATLSAELAQQTITLMAPSKTYNIAGLPCAYAIVPNKELRDRFVAAKKGLVSWVGSMGYAAAIAAYRHAQPWLDAVLCYLQANRDYTYEYVQRQLAGVHMGLPEGTYLAWFDCRELRLRESPHEFFLREARVAMNDGAAFGKGGEGFVRFNFACPRSQVTEALQRIDAALQRV